VRAGAGDHRPDARAAGLPTGGGPRAARALRSQSDLLLTPIQRSAWNRYSPKFA
jgi:hypothetical protein